MSTRKKLVVTFGVVALMGVVVFGTFAAFTATSVNSGNQIDSGTVKIDDDSGATTALYNVTNRKPGDTASGCLRVKYNGSLGASVKIYASAGITNGDDYTLTIERGSGLTDVDSGRDCTNFSSASTAYNGDLGLFGTTYAGGVDGKASAGAWAQNDAVDYRFTITQKDDTTVNGHTSVQSSGAHSFTWEAHNN